MQPGQDSQGRTAGTDSLDMTAKTRTVGTGQLGQDSQDRQQGKERQDSSAGTRQLGQGSQNHGDICS